MASLWLTCAPRDFAGDEDTFFSRDTGLLARGLRECGMETRAILIGAPRPDDAPDLVRASLDQLSDAAWWRAQGADTVVLQTWSLRPFTPIAAAIRAAGSRLVLIQDSGGITGPLSGWGDWLRESWYFSQASSLGPLRFIAHMLHGHTLRLLRFEKERAKQFALADGLAVPSPPAVARYRRLARRYGPGLEEKVLLVPHAVAPWFHYDGTSKERRIAAVGRWQDAHQKRPDLLTGSLEIFLRAHPDWQADVYGTADGMEAPPDLKDRMVFHGRVTSRELVAHLNRASILLCPSAYESFHIASAEALCCGAAVVAADTGMTATHRWFVSEKSGTLAARLESPALAAALVEEAEHWTKGERDPAAIAAIWSERLQARRVAASLIASLG